jgi:hypothetical protein
MGVEKRTPEWFLPFGTLWTFWSGKIAFQKRKKKRKKSFQNRSEAF